MVATLGTGVNRAAVHDRTGRTRLLNLPDTSNIEWGRVLNDISTAVVTAPVPASGSERDRCCGDFGKVHTWAHTLVVNRAADDQPAQRVWEGPIIRVTQRPSGMELIAWDVLGWLKKRRIAAARVIASVSSVTEVTASIQRGFTPDDPNVLAYLLNPDPGKLGRNVQRDIQADSGYIWEDVSSLTDMGVRVTTVGRRIIVCASNGIIGKTALLLPDNHLIADVEVIEDGEALATAASARDDKGHAAYVTAKAGVAVDPFYGLVQTIASSGAGTSNVTALTNQATAVVEDNYPAPLILNIPDDAQVRPDAPLPIDHLVPGTQVPVRSTATCVGVNSTFILSALSVKQAGGGNEEVGITLQPVSATAVTGVMEADVEVVA